MSTTVKTYFAVECVTNGISTWFGSLELPIKEFTAPGDILIQKDVTISAGGRATLWDYTDAKDFGCVVVLPQPGNETGFLYLDLLADSKDGSNNPTGSVERFRGQGHSCVAPYVLSSNKQQVNGTLATDVAESGGFAARNLDGATVEGRSFILSGYNPGTSATTQRVLIIGGSAS